MKRHTEGTLSLVVNQAEPRAECFNHIIPNMSFLVILSSTINKRSVKPQYAPLNHPSSSQGYLSITFLVNGKLINIHYPSMEFHCCNK
jgi:hypothetical protein